MRADTGRHAICRINGHCVIGAVRVLVSCGHQRQLEQVRALVFHRCTQKAGGVPNDPGHPLWCHVLGGHDGIAFIFATFVVGNQDWLASF